MTEKQESIVKILEKTVEEICDSYCKYPLMTPPEGKSSNWLNESMDSPCNDCPLLKLL